MLLLFCGMASGPDQAGVQAERGLGLEPTAAHEDEIDAWLDGLSRRVLATLEPIVVSEHASPAAAACFARGPTRRVPPESMR